MFYLWKLVDANTMTTIADLYDAKERSLNLMWNRPGSATCQLPIDSEAAYLARNHSTAILVEKNSQAVWSGPVFDITEDVPSDKITITAMGWMEEYNRRFIKAADEPSLVFNNTIGGQIAETLMNRCRADNGGVGPPRAVVSTYLDTQVRTRSYKAGTSYGQAITELSDIENGYDIKVHPLTRNVDFFAPQDSFEDRPSIVLGYNSPPHNVAQIQRKIDGTRTANRVNVATPVGLAIAQADESIAQQGVMLEQWLSLSDLKDIGIAGAYANAELAFFQNGGVNLSVRMKPSGVAGVPSWAYDFELGDRLYVEAHRGRMQITRQPVRVFSLSISIDSDGREQIGDIGVTYSS